MTRGVQQCTGAAFTSGRPAAGIHGNCDSKCVRQNGAARASLPGGPRRTHTVTAVCGPLLPICTVTAAVKAVSQYHGEGFGCDSNPHYTFVA